MLFPTIPRRCCLLMTPCPDDDWELVVSAAQAFPEQGPVLHAFRDIYRRGGIEQNRLPGYGKLYLRPQVFRVVRVVPVVKYNLVEVVEVVGNMRIRHGKHPVIVNVNIAIGYLVVAHKE